MNRDYTVDILRGIAIITMVAANYAAMLLAEPHPMWFRFYGSFAAPLFIFLAGVMIPLNHKSKNYNAGYFVRRGGYILLVAMLLDIFVWQIWPFTSVDVLYLIGVSLPLAYIFSKAARWSQIALMFFVFIFAFYLQSILGYIDYPSEWSLFETNPSWHEWSLVASHWMVDGWFPIFPWLGFCFLGVFVSQSLLRSSDAKRLINQLGLVGGLVVAVGVLIFNVSNQPLIIRDGYSEIFYPPTVAYCIIAIGVIGLMYFWVSKLQNKTILRIAAYYGRYSLSIYVLHLVVVEYTLSHFWENMALSEFGVLYTVSLVALWFYAYIRSYVGNRSRVRSKLGKEASAA